jgi:hypothetical protein
VGAGGDHRRGADDRAEDRIGELVLVGRLAPAHPDGNE